VAPRRGALPGGAGLPDTGRMDVDVTTWWLEMGAPAELRPARPAPGLAVARAEVPSPQLSRFLYTAVGGDWHWSDRLGWTYARWRAHLDRPEVETWVGAVGGTPVGYAELERDPRAGVELAYFGLLPEFMGRGLGGHLLTAAVRRAWAMGADRVWVHTCTLDGPHALANYRARGFRVVREETSRRRLPDAPPGPWPGARPEPPAPPSGRRAAGAGGQGRTPAAQAPASATTPSSSRR
jgi:ribosomal protein S18 acetylase RimI-like enzyme